MSAATFERAGARVAGTRAREARRQCVSQSLGLVRSTSRRGGRFLTLREGLAEAAIHVIGCRYQGFCVEPYASVLFLSRSRVLGDVLETLGLAGVPGTDRLRHRMRQDMAPDTDRA